MSDRISLVRPGQDPREALLRLHCEWLSPAEVQTAQDTALDGEDVDCTILISRLESRATERRDSWNDPSEQDLTWHLNSDPDVALAIALAVRRHHRRLLLITFIVVLVVNLSVAALRTLT